MRSFKLLLIFCFLICSIMPVSAEFSTGGNVYKMDDIEIIAVLDASTDLKQGILLGDEALIKELMPDESKKSSVNTFVIKKGESIILVDTGFGAPKGKTVENLKRMGIMPEMINSILFTHLHGDHVGGLLENGEIVFPNAKIFISQDEYNYWFHEGLRSESANPAAFDFAMGAINAYGEQVVVFEHGLEILPGIVAIDEPGHTPGHVGFLVITENEKLLIWGDITHFNDVQMTAPQLSVTFDVDSERAKETRLFILDWVATEGIYVAGAHIIHPGIGKVRLEDGHYFFEVIGSLNE